MSKNEQIVLRVLARHVATKKRYEAKLEATIEQTVAQARREGVSWRKIADAMGIVVSNAYNRYKHLDQGHE